MELDFSDVALKFSSKSNIDYDLKARVLELGLDEIQRKVSKAIYFHDFPSKNYIPEMSYELALHYEKFYSSRHSVLWEEAKKINHARYHRVRRLKHYIKNMLNLGDCVFLTFTFSDKTFSKVSDSSRKAYVQRFLTSYNTLYVANKDFGHEKGREHYHAVIRTDKVDFSEWKYGRIGGERVKSIEDSPKLAKYVAKLTNHAIKETTKRSNLMYSRVTFSDYEKNEKLTQLFNTNFDEIENAILPFEDEYKQDCLFG